MKMRREVVSLLLVLVSFILFWAYSHALDHYSMTAVRDLKYGWSGWIWWVLLVVCAGIAFGLAAVLPTHWHYHPIRALILGTLPLLAIVHEAMVFGPLISLHVWSFLNHVYFFDIVPAAEVFLGVAIAAGFGSSDEDRPRTAGTS